MPSLDLLLPFFVATALFACVPGPGMLYAAAQTIARGRRAGWLSALGFHIGGYVHVVAAAFGLSLLLETVPLAYTAVKLAGAAYLVWLGLRFLLSPGAAVVPRAAATPQRHALRDSIVVEVLNPKTALFYLAFLPQFTDVAAALPVWGQVLILGSIVSVMFSATDAVCILLAAQVARSLAASQWMARGARRLAGGIMIALGLRLATSEP